MSSKKKTFFKNNPLLHTNEDNASVIVKTTEIKVISQDLENNILLDLNETDRRTIKDYEELVKFNINKAGEHLLIVSKALYEAQKIFAKNKSGKFQEWYNNLNLEKTYVYRLLQKYELFLTYQKKEVMNLPVRVATTLASKKTDFEDAEIIEIIEAEKPSEVLKKIQKIKQLENEELRILTKEDEKKLEEIKNKKFILKQQKEQLLFKIKNIEEEISKLKDEEKKIKYIIK